MSIEPYVYPPRDREEVERRLDEHYANLACRDGMEEIIRNSFDGARLDSNCARKAIEEFGIQRVELVLAVTIQRRSWDGRFSQRVKEWANAWSGDTPSTPTRSWWMDSSGSTFRRWRRWPERP